jgi:dolichol-phosphate mannosyltransferase
VLKKLAGEVPSLRVVRHRQRRGQSAAILTGVRAARASVITTLDGDGQNDPADVQKLFAAYRANRGATPFMAAGHRQRRQDSWAKRLASRLANGVRSSILRDSTPDTGCGLKVFGREDFLRLPAFDHMHRFLPALILRSGGRVESIPVSHRARARGTSKYGVWDRFWVGVQDLRGVAWLMRRPIVAEVAETLGE